MEIKELQSRIEKTEAKIEKINKRIKKWEAAKCEEAFIKADGWLLNMGRDRDYLYQEYLKNCDDEIKRALRDLEDEELKLQKYRNLLNLELNKDNEFENNRIKVIWDFLLHYKEQVAQYIRNNMEVLNEYYKTNSESCDWYNNHRSIIKEQGITEEQWKEHYRELNQKEKELKANIHPYTSMVAKHNGYRQPHTVNEEKLEEILLKDCKARYFELVDEVTKYTGIITDATNLTIRGGELNGIIIGEKGKAKVLTFSAGGWNIQCFHYRTKVSEVK